MIKKVTALVSLGMAASLLAACSNDKATKSESSWDKVKEACVL